MGKTSRPFPTGHLRLNPRKDATGDTPLVIQLEYVIKGRPLRRSTGYKAKPCDWDKTANKSRGGVKASYGVDYRNLNQRLGKLLDSIDRRMEDYCEKNSNNLNWDIAVAIVDNKPQAREDHGIDFQKYVEDILEAEKARNKIGQSVYKNGLSAMNIFSEFLTSQNLGTYEQGKIFVSEITTGLIERYIAWRRKVKKNTDATINHAMTPILKGCQKAALEGYIPHSLNSAIQGMRIITQKSLENDDDNQIRHLSKKTVGEVA